MTRAFVARRHGTVGDVRTSYLCGLLCSEAVRGSWSVDFRLRALPMPCFSRNGWTRSAVLSQGPRETPVQRTCGRRDGPGTALPGRRGAWSTCTTAPGQGRGEQDNRRFSGHWSTTRDLSMSQNGVVAVLSVTATIGLIDGRDRVLLSRGVDGHIVVVGGERKEVQELLRAALWSPTTSLSVL